MASPSSIATEQEISRHISVKQQPPRPARENVVKRLMVAGARKLHDLSFAFPALVRGFRVLQRFGINLTPNHFYYPVPDLTELEKREWPRYSFPPGCDFDLQKQLEFAWQVTSQFGDECDFSTHPHEHAYHYNNGYFESVDAEMAYCMVRQFKPARIIEIGTGYSTRLLAAALKKNAECGQIEGKLLSVDPSPQRFSPNGWEDLVIQVPTAIQELDLDFVNQLESGDFLFIDSSHVAGIGSDVVHEYLEILPRLKPGVIVHVHDIFLPSDYPRDAVLNQLWFWSEQYLLQAFLSFNNHFEVLWGSSAMAMHHSWALEQFFPRWRRSYAEMPESKRRFVPTMDGLHVWPSSFWMRRV